MNFQDVINVFSIVASLAAALGLFLVAWQTREAEKARQLQATIAIFDDLGSEDNRQLRRFVYNALSNDPEKFTEEDMAKVERLCAAFNRAGLLSNRKLINTEIVLAMYGEATTRCWDKLRPFVEREETAWKAIPSRIRKAGERRQEVLVHSTTMI